MNPLLLSTSDEEVEIKSRKSYNTKIKYLAREGILPETYRKKINKCLFCRWKQGPKEKYVGYELNTNL